MMERKELTKHNDTMRGWYFADEADAVMDAMEARIKELEASQPKWISVKNRLPETNLEVLIWLDGIGVQLADFYVEDKGFYIEDYKHPSYWMPLPQPPKAGK